MVLESILNPVLSPLLAIPTLWAIVIISFIISLLTTLAYKFFTDQKLMKDIKEENKKLQKEMKEFKGDMAKVSELNKQMMQRQMKMMTQSLKVTLYTIIPLLIIFGWLSSVMAYQPLKLGEPFTVTAYSAAKINLTSTPELEITGKEENAGSTIWTLSGKEGKYTLLYDLDSETKSNDIIITNKQEYANPKVSFKGSRLEGVEVGNKKTAPFGDLEIFGYIPGWLMTYIFFSLIFSLGMRKVLKVY